MRQLRRDVIEQLLALIVFHYGEVSRFRLERAVAAANIGEIDGEMLFHPRHVVIIARLIPLTLRFD